MFAVVLGWATLYYFRNVLGVLKSFKTISFGKGTHQAVAHRTTQPPQQSTEEARDPISGNSSRLFPHQFWDTRHREQTPICFYKNVTLQCRRISQHTPGLKLPETFWGLPQAWPEVRGRRPY